MEYDVLLRRRGLTEQNNYNPFVVLAIVIWYTACLFKSGIIKKEHMLLPASGRVKFTKTFKDFDV